MNQAFIEQVLAWGEAKGLHTDNLAPQLIKLTEELGEIAAGVARQDPDRIIDGVGDFLVVLLQFGACMRERFPELRIAPEDFLQVCLATAWSEIQDRTGKTVDGVFVRDLG